MVGLLNKERMSAGSCLVATDSVISSVHCALFLGFDGIVVSWMAHLDSTAGILRTRQ